MNATEHARVWEDVAERILAAATVGTRIIRKELMPSYDLAKAVAAAYRKEAGE
jgi:hypothetical protein